MSDGKSKLLLECGVTFKEIKHALDYKVSELAGCLLTHGHLDHSRSVEDVMKAGIDIYTSQGTIEALSLSGHRVHAVQAEKQFQIGGWRIMPLEAQHDFPETLAFLIANDKMERLLFAIDTAYLKYRFVGLNIIAVECNYSMGILRTNVDTGAVEACLKNRIVKSHFSLENIKELLRANDLSKVQQIWLLHLSDGNSDEKRFKREVMELTGKMVFVA
ncbi:MAG: MBL fold metallo-hydrolase [Dehalococcoidales bacterium]|nr:MBL fold metallo-hydrolase [Dehalococcoidales bacterium]